jgi:hypothetical protein
MGKNSVPDTSAHQLTCKAATAAAKNALITCALAFASDAHPDRAVLFAVAQSYTLISRTRDDDERFDTGNVDIDDTGALRRQLARAEAELCLASSALSEFGRGTVQRLLRAARVYTEASELERSWAARAETCARTARGADAVSSAGALFGRKPRRQPARSRATSI